MRADICDSDDDAAVERFRNALRRIGAELSEKGWALGVDVYRVSIDGEELTIFSDAWSIDIEGPPHVVERVLRELQPRVA
jgi:hypothetical protein